MNAVVVRSTFPSQECQKLTVSDHFWKSTCRKSARCSGAKHICKPKASKTEGPGPLFDIQMSKKCTPLWRTEGFGPLFKFRCRKSARRCGAKHISKSKVSKTDGLGPLLDGHISFCLACARDSVKREGL